MYSPYDIEFFHKISFKTLHTFLPSLRPSCEPHQRNKNERCAATFSISSFRIWNKHEQQTNNQNSHQAIKFYLQGLGCGPTAQLIWAPDFHLRQMLLMESFALRAEKGKNECQGKHLLRKRRWMTISTWDKNVATYSTTQK